MRLKQDKILKRNLKLLYNCSKIQEIRLRSLNSEAISYLHYLDSKEGKPFRTQLENLMAEMFEQRGEAPLVVTSSSDLIGFEPDKDAIPERFKKDYKRHMEVSNNIDSLSDLDQQLEELQKLQHLAKTSSNGTENLNKFMFSQENSPRFQAFCKHIDNTPSSILNIEHFHLAIDVARKNNLYSPKFKSRLRATLPKPIFRIM